MKDLFKYYFTNKAYLPEYLEGRLFTPLHFVVMAIMIVAVPLLAFLCRKMSKKKLKILFAVLWIVMSGFEIAKIVWESCTNPGGFEPGGILPLYVCSIFIYIMPFAIWTKEGSLARRSACGYLCTTNMVGGLVNFVYPANVLSNYSAISFAGLHALVFHATMVFVALLMLFSGYYSLTNIKDAALAFLPLFAVSIIANIINFTLPADYMFFHGWFFPFTLISAHMPVWCFVILLYAIYFLLPYLFYLPYFIYSKIKKKKESK